MLTTYDAGKVGRTTATTVFIHSMGPAQINGNLVLYVVNYTCINVAPLAV
ncbi:unnamed protein product [Acanthoscelides obtectus]|uniref:Uncharacterized protein n=1 Tax=Acanthoscelides obtectus TaxID=200917 RepID=A0A9P0PL36_ACAOB|nr:unnamed protein product [Acanthoscelides obtectus]CAK1649607.1 hypothetical protein AOBTE_LOCUS16328 [Acanthoscelides obtectus]